MVFSPGGAAGVWIFGVLKFLCMEIIKKFKLKSEFNAPVWLCRENTFFQAAGREVWVFSGRVQVIKYF
jgi:hypothetical protein